MDKLNRFFKKKGYVAVKLHPLMQAGGEPVHYLIKARINGRKGLFLLDTGATHTMLDVQKAGKFGIKVEKPDEDMLFVGASEDALDVQMAGEPVRIRIKDWKRKGFPLFLMDLTHVNELIPLDLDGIIGTDVLLAAKAVVDYGNGKLYLKTKK